MVTHYLKSPSRISFSGWNKIVRSVIDQVSENNISIISAGVAFYSFLAIFPAIAAMVSIYGLAMNPESIQAQLSIIYGMMPREAYEILKTQLENLVNTSESALGWSMIISILLSIWSANKGTKSLFTGINIAYNVKNERGFLKQNALTLIFTFGAVCLLIISMVLIVAFPVLVERIGVPVYLETIIGYGRWILLGLLLIWFLGEAYKYAPVKKAPNFKWVAPGAILATFFWLLASWAFSFYASNFGSYGEVYGSISAVVVLLLWLFITSFIILIGAEFNSEIEIYTRSPIDNEKKPF